MSMEFASLDANALSISRIGLGCEQLGGTDWGKFDLDSALQTVAHAVRCGVNVFDTADVYGLGRSEELLSQALRDDRNSAFIISKCGIRWRVSAGAGRAKTFRDGSAAYVQLAVDDSLRRLRLYRLPAYLVHWPDPNVPVVETIAGLDRCRKAGKIKYIGVSNFSLTQLEQACEVATIDLVEAPYNLLDRHAENELFPFCRQHNIAIVTYGPLAQGLLSGKYSSNIKFGEDDRRHRLRHFQPDALKKNLQTILRLREVSARKGYSPAQVALSWVFGCSAVTCVLAGAKSSAQFDENLGALQCKLTDGERAYLNAEVENL